MRRQQWLSLGASVQQACKGRMCLLGLMLDRGHGLSQCIGSGCTLVKCWHHLGCQQISSQHSQPMDSSRCLTIVSSSSTYAQKTCLGIPMGLPSLAPHLASQSFSIVSWVMEERSRMYHLIQIATASISHCLATCPSFLHATH